MSDIPVVPLPGAPGPGESRWQLWLRNGLTAIYTVYAVGTSSGLLLDFDPMMLSGSSSAIVGLWLGAGVRRRMHAALDRMRTSGTLLLTADQLQSLHRELDRTGARFGRWGAAITALAEAALVCSASVLVPWLVYGVPPLRYTSGTVVVGVIELGTFAGLLLISIVAGAGVGYYLGQFAGYGRLQELIGTVGGSLKPHGDAADGTGGLRPLVDFVWRQAASSLLPVLWISIWLVLTCFEPWSGQFGFWRFPLFVLFGLAVLYAWLGFFAPARMLTGLFDREIARATASSSLAGRLVRARRRIASAASGFGPLVGTLVLAFFGSGMPLFSQGGLTLFLFGPPG